MLKRITFIFLLIFFLNILSAEEYYICLGSFTKNNNIKEYSDNLNKSGIPTVFEKVDIKGNSYIRIIYSKKFIDLKLAVKEMKALKINSIILKAKVKDLWIRPGKINITQNDEIKKRLITINQEIPKTGETINLSAKKDLAVKIDSNKSTALREDDAKNQILKKDDKSIKTENSTVSAKSDSAGKMVFSNKPVELGKESSNEIKMIFTKPEKFMQEAISPKLLVKSIRMIYGMRSGSMEYFPPRLLLTRFRIRAGIKYKFMFLKKTIRMN